MIAHRRHDSGVPRVLHLTRGMSALTNCWPIMSLKHDWLVCSYVPGTLTSILSCPQQMAVFHSTSSFFGKGTNFIYGPTPEKTQKYNTITVGICSLNVTARAGRVPFKWVFKGLKFKTRYFLCTMETLLLTETEKCNHVLSLWSFCDGHTWYRNKQKSEALFYLQEQTAVWSKHIRMAVMISKWIATQKI